MNKSIHYIELTMSNSKLRKYEENNWACIVVCLKKTGNVLHTTIEERFKEEIEGWDGTTKEQFKAFTDGLSDNRVQVAYVTFSQRQKRQITNAWEISRGDTSYGHILKKVLAIHSNPRNKKIQWGSNVNKASESYWILAKMFMPYGNSLHDRPSQADPISFFDLLRNCTLFKDFDVDVIQQLCCARNEVMHSIDHRITEDQKLHYICIMEKLLNTPCLKVTKDECDMTNLFLERMKKRYIYFEDVSLERLETEFRNTFPNTSFNRNTFLEDTSNLYGKYVSSGIKNLKEELEKDKRNLSIQQAEVEKYKSIGGITGAAAVGITGFTAASAVAGAVGATVGAPVVLAGTIAAGLGYLGGRAGGAVIGLFRRII